MSRDYNDEFPATAYTVGDPVATEFAKLYRPHSTDHGPGMKATDLIVLNQTPSYTEPRMTTEFLECMSLGQGAPLDGWGPTDESTCEKLAIASYMVPEILDDDDYKWGELYDATPGIPFHTTQGERDLREQINKIHFPSKLENDTFFAISDEDIRRGQWIIPGPGSRADLEWDECQELSYFIEFDQATDDESFIVDNRGRPALHNAERHEQRCALNALFNHPELDLKVKSTITSLDGSGYTLNQEVEEKPHIFDQCGIQGVECSLVASGDNFSTAICRYGAVFVPKRCQKFINEDGTFTAKLTISAEGAKYPLRVAEITRC